MEVQSEFTVFILQLVQNYPIAATVFMVMGLLRSVFKPIMGVVQAYVNQTETISDNEKFEAFKNSRIYKSISWIVDLFSSVKLPKSK